ncbi:hypothetical protein Tco_0923024 [Tanacetum coccineum]|uniref:Uncharacterized protein n=1 Tax=Tanacetum coccineum TaxID=301880 RepID=A0ABQ5D142_9ASTR
MGVLYHNNNYENGTSVTKMSVLVTAEEKTNKKNNVKARSLLLMALPNEHQLTFSQYNDSKTMFAAIKTRFGVLLASVIILCMLSWLRIPMVLIFYNQDLDQIHEDDLEAMDLKWQLSLLSMRAKSTKEQGGSVQKDNTRKQGNNKDTSSKAMLAIDGVGFNWSDMAEEEVQINMALMAFLESEVINLTLKLV